MTEEPTLYAYAVTLVFGAGPIVQDARLAPDPAAAAAAAMFNIMRVAPPKEDVTGVSVMPLPLEWLRYAVRSMETGQADGQVLSLVRAGEPAPEPTHDAERCAAKRVAEAFLPPLNLRRRCFRHSMDFPADGHCSMCAAEDDGPAAA